MKAPHLFRWALALALAAPAWPAASQELGRQIDELLAEAARLASAKEKRSGSALPLLRRAARLAEQEQDALRSARAWQRVAQAQWSTSDFEGAIETARVAAARARAAGALGVESDALRVEGMALGSLARLDEAMRPLTAAAERGRLAGDAEAEARALNSLSVAARNQGRLAGSVAHARAALAVVDRAPAGAGLSPLIRFAAPFNLGKGLAESGDFLAAAPFLERAFATAEADGSIGGQHHALYDTAEWYLAQGDLERAERYHRRCLEQARRYAERVETRDFAPKCLLGLGSVAQARGEHAAAADFFREALSLEEEADLETFVSDTLGALARAQRQSGRAPEARRTIERAVQRAEASGQAGSLVRALLERARQRAALDPSGAAADCQAALRTARRNGQLPSVPAALAQLAELAARRGDLEQAASLYREGAQAVEAIRGRISTPDLRAAFGDATHATYAGLVATELLRHAAAPGAGHDRLALLALERERSHELSATLRGAGVEPARGEQQAEPERRIAEVQVMLFASETPPRRRAELVAELEDLERSSAMRAAGRAPTPPPEGLAGLQLVLAPEEAALVYFLEATHSALFVVTRESLRAVAIDAGRAGADRIERFAALLSSPNGASAVAVGRELAEALVRPALSELGPGKRRLLVVASGPLAGLPFAALPDPVVSEPRPLLARFEVAAVPSLAVLARLRGAHGPEPTRDLIAFANPTPAGLAKLPDSVNEVRAAARRAAAGSELLVAGAATESALKRQRLREFKVIHFATHALLDPRVPARSAILLAQPDPQGEDGLLQAREVFGLELEARVVVLSACRTAAGRASNAEGLQSLSGAFLFAGARSVTGTLWDVADAATARLVERLYAGLAAGRPVAEALRQAQLGPAGAAYSDSRDWAGFVIAGDPLARVVLTPAPFPAALPWFVVGVLVLLGLAFLRRLRNQGARRAPMIRRLV